MSPKKEKELRNYLFDNFGLTFENGKYLEEINRICNKAEKDYIFEDENCNGCDNCNCKELSHFGSLEDDRDNDTPF